MAMNKTIDLGMQRFSIVLASSGHRLYTQTCSSVVLQRPGGQLQEVQKSSPLGPGLLNTKLGYCNIKVNREVWGPCTKEAPVPWKPSSHQPPGLGSSLCGHYMDDVFFGAVL